MSDGSPGDVSGCPRWPPFLGFLSNHGELTAGKCGSINHCPHCARWVATVNAEMLLLGAIRAGPPEVWAVLTTRTVELDMAPFYRGREKMVKALRRRWPIEYACLLEFTTGYGIRSGGERRPHWNLLFRGVDRDQVEELGTIVRRVWCDHVDALPEHQHVGEVTGAEGLVRYVALHFQKESQAPPAGFRGQRFNCSRGYFGDASVADMRIDARLSLADKALLERARELGLEGDDAEDWVDAHYAAAGITDWRLYSQRRPETTPEFGPSPVPRDMIAAAAEWQEEQENIAWAYASYLL